MSARHTYRHVVVQLLKGPVNREDEELWAVLNRDYPKVRDYLSVLGLEVVRDEDAGYACLRQQESGESGGDNWKEDGEAPLPALMRSERLRYKPTLFLVLLREEQLRFDHSQEGGDFLYRSLTELREMLEPYLGQGGDEKSFHKTVDALISRACGLGVLRELRGSRDEPVYRVERILKEKLPPETLQQIWEELNKHLQAKGVEVDTESDSEEEASEEEGELQDHG